MAAPVPELKDSPAPVELEHLVGFSGKFLQSVLFHPTAKDTIVYSVGSLLVIADLNDPHKQDIVRADHEITAFDVSPNGQLLAAGQADGKAVLVWDYNRRAPLFSLYGLTSTPLQLRFSLDGRLLAASGLHCH